MAVSRMRNEKFVIWPLFGLSAKIPESYRKSVCIVLVSLTKQLTSAHAHWCN